MTKQGTLLDYDPAARREFDYYPTPAYQTLALLRREGNIGDVLEPCCGDGAIVRVLKSSGIDVAWTNDLDTRWVAYSHLDITDRATWDKFAPWRWCVTNWPFELANEAVPLAYEFMPKRPDCGLACILRLTWLEPTGEQPGDGRWQFLETHPPNRIIVLPRTDYRGNGKTDSVTSAWFVWYGDSPINAIGVVTKRERDFLNAQRRLETPPDERGTEG